MTALRFLSSFCLFLFTFFIPFFSHAQVAGNLVPTVPLYYGIYQYAPIYHENGNLAWSGHFSEGRYAADSAFFHINGLLAWGGIKQSDQKRIVDEAKFYYINGQVAWSGLRQTEQTWVSDNAKFYHSNGQLAWGGLDQNKQAWSSDNAKFYHSNGQLAWDGNYGSKVYFENGRVAWEGKARSNVYDLNGKCTAIADHISLHLGLNNWLHISSKRKGMFELTLNLGPAYRLRAINETIILNVYNETIDNF